MSKLNPKGKNTSTNIVAAAQKTGQKLGFSANGNLQFVKEPLQMLYELTVSTLLGKGTFYKTSDRLVEDLKKHVKTAVDMNALDFVANLAIHARVEMNIRTIPVVLVVEFAKAIRDSGKQYPNMRHLVRDVIQRADQINDLYSYALEVFGGKNNVPMAIKRGVADAFNKFSEYHFAKYNRSEGVKFRDVLRIVHPVPQNEVQGAIFEKIMKETLESPYTWEVELSKNGQLPPAERKSNAQLWTELVQSGEMGYMALLRNLRNIHQAGLEPNVLKTHVTNVIADPKRVATSKQLPFDFVEAYSIVKELDSSMATAVSKAIDLSVGNIPPLGDKVWVILDMSGSMGRDPEEYPRGNNYASAMSTALLLAAALLKANGDASKLAITLFGSEAKTLKGVDTNNSIIGIKRELLSHRTGSISGSTNFAAALRQKANLGFEPDTILVLTDGEVNSFPYSTIKQIVGPKVMKLAINLSASTTTPMPASDGWYTLAGWSSAMFKWVPAMRDAGLAVDQLSGPYREVPIRQRKI